MKYLYKYTLPACFIIFILGPAPSAPELNKKNIEINIEINEVSEWLKNKESKIKNIKDDNHSKVIFFDSIPQKTEYSIVYLHGFSGSSQDGAPVHEMVARELGFNLYLPRLYAHGLDDEEPLLNYTGEKSLDSAREAIAVGKILGKKIILMGTSTGCSLALNLANDPKIAALVMYAPNIKVNHPLAFVATLPWGLQIIRLIKGGKYHYIDDMTTEKMKYWTHKYRLEAVVQMQKLIETSMIESTFNQVTCPVFSGFYYRNEKEQDQVVSVDHMREMFTKLGTEKNLKEQISFKNAEKHEIASRIANKNYLEVKDSTIIFLKRVLSL